MFYPWVQRVNATYRPSEPLNLPADDSQPIQRWYREVLQQWGKYKGRALVPEYPYSIDLFVDARTHLSWVPMILVFCKLYDPEKEELRYVGRWACIFGRVLLRLRVLGGFRCACMFWAGFAALGWLAGALRCWDGLVIDYVGLACTWQLGVLARLVVVGGRQVVGVLVDC